MSKDKRELRPCKARFVVGVNVPGIVGAVQTGKGWYDGVTDVAEIDEVDGGRKLDEPLLCSSKTAIIQLLKR